MYSEPCSALLMALWKTKNTLLNAASVENFISLKRNLEDFPDFMCASNFRGYDCTKSKINSRWLSCSLGIFSF